MENWWSEESTEQFEEKTQCLIDQYGSYKVRSKHVSFISLVLSLPPLYDSHWIRLKRGTIDKLLRLGNSLIYIKRLEKQPIKRLTWVLLSVSLSFSLSLTHTNTHSSSLLLCLSL